MYRKLQATLSGHRAISSVRLSGSAKAICCFFWTSPSFQSDSKNVEHFGRLKIQNLNFWTDLKRIQIEFESILSEYLTELLTELLTSW